MHVIAGSDSTWRTSSVCPAIPGTELKSVRKQLVGILSDAMFKTFYFSVE